MSTNPYEALPVSSLATEYTGAQHDTLAPRSTRFVAALVDGIILMLAVLPVQLLFGFPQRLATGQAGVLEQILMGLVGFGVMLAVNGYLLFHNGQTVGKMLFKIQIVDAESNKLLPFLRVYVLRYLWTLPLSIIAAVIPGTADGMILNAAIIIDILLIFGAPQRCLHDYIAGSKVVLFRPNRERLA
jgi:uncharacterized RDD family membrane protein YckC